MTDMPLIAKVTDDDFLAFLRDQENELWEVPNSKFEEWSHSPFDIDELYNAILAHRGVEEDKFIYVFHPFEDASDSANAGVDWTKVPVITKNQLSGYYGSGRPGRSELMFECSNVNTSEGDPLYLYPVENSSIE